MAASCAKPHTEARRRRNLEKVLALLSDLSFNAALSDILGHWRRMCGTGAPRSTR